MKSKNIMTKFEMFCESIKKPVKLEGNEHIVGDLYVDDLLDKKIKIGSPGYLMVFIPREIYQLSKTKFEIIGDLPSATTSKTDNSYIIGLKQLKEFYEDGETFWIAKDGAHIAMSY